MLEHFTVDESETIVVHPSSLLESVTSLFVAKGASQKDARIGAEVLVDADVRGVDTHGVSNMLRRYLGLIDEGFVNPRPNWKIVHETSGTATVDCDQGLGIVVLPQLMDIAVEKAANTGTATILAGNGRHAGMLAYHAMQALKHDMIGYAVTAGGQIMVPTFGGAPRLGTNPHSWAVPAATRPPFVLDVSSTVVAANKIDLLRRHQTNVLPGWVADEKGQPIEQPQLPPDFTWLLPLGSTRVNGSQKGYGLGAIAQILTGVLFSGDFGDYGKGRMNHMLTATNIAAFTDVGDFKARMDEFLEYLEETPPVPGAERVVYPGLLEHEESVNRAEGVPLHREVVAWLNGTLEAAGLDSVATDR